MTVMYKCDLLVTSSSLGKVYSVLNRRDGKVLSEEMKVGRRGRRVEPSSRKVEPSSRKVGSSSRKLCLIVAIGH